MRKISILQSTYIRFYKKLLCKSKYKPKSNYKSTLRQLSRKHIIDNPQQSILKRTTAICSILLLFSSITPAEPLIASNFDLDDSFNPYLNQEDLEYNMSQVLATNEGFLIKNMPFSDSQTDERLTFQSHIVQEGESLLDVAKKYGLQVETIVWENGIVNLDDITPGHELSIPPIDGLTHTISKGENLSAIATKYRVDFYDIEKVFFGEQNIFSNYKKSILIEVPRGTHHYRGKWSSLDRIFVLKKYLSPSCNYYGRCFKVLWSNYSVIKKPFMLHNESYQDDGGRDIFYENVPWRFDAETGEGYSDHLPVISTFYIR